MVPFIAPKETSTLYYLPRYMGATGSLMLKYLIQVKEVEEEREAHMLYSH